MRPPTQTDYLEFFSTLYPTELRRENGVFTGTLGDHSFRLSLKEKNSHRRAKVNYLSLHITNGLPDFYIEFSDRLANAYAHDLTKFPQSIVDFHIAQEQCLQEMSSLEKMMLHLGKFCSPLTDEYISAMRATYLVAEELTGLSQAHREDLRVIIPGTIPDHILQ